jgi:urease accessory protein
MRITFASSILLFAAAPALFAHPGHAHPGHAESGLAAGIAHPLAGVDHWLAMLAVGVMALRCAQRPGNHQQALWQVPASFMAAMVLGGALAIVGLPLPLAEWGIALSVLVFGVLIALTQAPRTWLACGVVGVFAVMHGHAHMAEMSSPTVSMTTLATMGGFLATTAALHAAGIAAGWWVAQAWQQSALRAIGVGVALASVGLFVGLV